MSKPSARLSRIAAAGLIAAMCVLNSAISASVPGSAERSGVPGLAHLVQVEERGSDVAAGGAAEAAGARHHHVGVADRDEVVVDRDGTELVHDDGGVGEGRVGEEIVEKRRLAGAEEAGEDGDGQALRGGRHDGPP